MPEAHLELVNYSQVATAQQQTLLKACMQSPKTLQIMLQMSGQIACILCLAAVLFQLLCACTILAVSLAGGDGVLKDAVTGYVGIQTVCSVLWADLYRAWT